MPLPVIDRRAEKYRAHARKLAEASRRAERMEDRRHLIDLASTYMRAADATAPLPPAEPPVSTATNSAVAARRLAVKHGSYLPPSWERQKPER
jgi:hypothetical protein